MSLAHSPSFPDVALPHVTPAIPWQARDGASINRRVLGLEAQLPRHRRGSKPLNLISDWLSTTSFGLTLLWSLIVGACIGFWTALWLFLPAVVFPIVAALPVAAGLSIAGWACRREMMARRHVSFRLARMFGV